MKNEQFTYTKTALVLLSFIFLLAFSFCSKDEEKEPSPPPANGDNGSGGAEILTVTDREGNVYKAVEIGDQIWMAENLNTKNHDYGYSMCQMGSPLYCALYGRMYDFAAILNGDDPLQFKVQGICPDGWRLPLNNDWIELEIFLGMPEDKAYNFHNHERSTIEGKLLKSETLWNDERNGTNAYGFNVLPGGNDSSIQSIGAISHFWSVFLVAGPVGGEEAIIRTFTGSDRIALGAVSQSNYNYLRCIKDIE